MINEIRIANTTEHNDVRLNLTIVEYQTYLGFYCAPTLTL